MTFIKIFLATSLLISCFLQNVVAQQTMRATQNNRQMNLKLNGQQQAIVAISAFTAKGDLASLKQSLNEGLNAGLPVNDIKEILVQLYAYCGFPRSLNALNALMAVVKERKEKGLTDAVGIEPSPLPANKTKLQLGTELQTKLIGQPVKGEVYAFAPAIDQFLKEHLFGDIFGRDNLDWKTRELATISALAGLGGADAQLRSHIGVSIHNGISPPQLQQVIAIIQTKVGSKEGNAASDVLQAVLKQNQNSTPVNQSRRGDGKGSAEKKEEMIIRMAELEIYPQHLEEYKTILKEAAATSVGVEPGVISIFPMFKKGDSTGVRIVEIYASKEAYEAHLKTPHFQKYKTTTLNMVKSLQLVDMDAIDTANMSAIFGKLRE